MNKCELCDSRARMYCESDQASLCWDCDARVHSANFLVAKHSRTLLCHLCQSPTPWTGSGPKLGPTVSVCDKCVNRCNTREERNNIERRGDGDDDDDHDGSNEDEDDDDDDDDDDDGEDEDEDDEENQVVPWSSTDPPSVSSSSNSDQECSGGFSSKEEGGSKSRIAFSLKRTRGMLSTASHVRQ